MAVDPALTGVKAFEHPAVKEWWQWVTEDYRTRHDVALLTPCSSVKPYTRSPTSVMVRNALLRLGLWDSVTARPVGLDWVYLSDLLVLVPYEKATSYPACCYDVTPSVFARNPSLRYRYVSILAEAVSRLACYGLRKVLVYLPRRHLTLWELARSIASDWPEEARLKFSIYTRVNDMASFIAQHVEVDRSDRGAVWW